MARGDNAPQTNPSLSDPAAQQAAAAAEAERKRQAADLANRTEHAHAQNSPVSNSIASGGEAIDDFFSAETVNGPPGGTGWGASGTAGATYNAENVQQGLTDKDYWNGQGAIAANNGLAQGQQANQDAQNTAWSLQNQANAAQGRQTPTTNYTAANRYAGLGDEARTQALDYTNNAGNASQQQAQLSALNAFANAGPGPSAAAAQQLQASDAAQAGALSLARSGRGAGDSASALRDATFSNAQNQAQTAQSLAGLRAQEAATFRGQQLQALDAAMGGAGAIRGSDAQAAQLAQGTRGQDLSSQAQSASQNQFLTNAQLQQQQQNDAYASQLGQLGLGYTGEGNQTNLGFQSLGQQTGLGYANLGQGAAIDYANLGQNALNSQANYELSQQQMNLDAAKANQQADLEKDSGLSGMIGAVGGALMMSDERSKTEIRRLEGANAALSSALGGVDGKDALDTVGNAPGYSYKYKNPDQPGAKPGTQYGPMAQDLEKGPLGDSLVMNTPQGKMVDGPRVAMLDAAAITELNRKVQALEAALGKKAA